MSLTPEIINRTAHLAHLELNEAEQASLAPELNKILAFVDQLQAVNTEGVEPLEHALNMTQPLRNDAVTESNLRDAMQAIAPETHDGLYLVPAVIDSPEE